MTAGTAPRAGASKQRMEPTALRPRGLTVALLGPDGSGKTTLARTLALDSDSCRIYMGSNADSRDRTLPTTAWVRRAKQTLAGRVAEGGSTALAWRAAQSLVKTAGFADRLIDRAYRYTLARYQRRVGQVVIFDRYVLDPRVGNPDNGPRARMRAWLLRAGAPRPDLTVLLDAPVEVLRARKSEQSGERLELLRDAYLELPKKHPEIHVIDVARDLDAVLEDVRTLIRNKRSVA